MPYYYLPNAQQLFARTALYRDRANVSRSYFFGPDAVVANWRGVRETSA
ncbi:MAG: hypothetical protein QM586_17865 [Xenophilus sp.]